MLPESTWEAARPDKVIHAPVQVLDGLGVAAVAVQMPEEHVLHAIAGVEHTRHHAAGRLFQGVAKHRLALGQDQVRLVEKCLFVDDAFVQRPGVFRHAERRVGAEQFRQVRGVEGRVTDR